MKIAHSRFIHLSLRLHGKQLFLIPSKIVCQPSILTPIKYIFSESSLHIHFLYLIIYPIISSASILFVWSLRDSGLDIVCDHDVAQHWIYWEHDFQSPYVFEWNFICGYNSQKMLSQIFVPSPGYFLWILKTEKPLYRSLETNISIKWW